MHLVSLGSRDLAAAQVRALHPPDGAALQEGARDAPGAEDHVRDSPQKKRAGWAPKPIADAAHRAPILPDGGPPLRLRFQLPIIGVKKNPSSPLYTQLGVITKGTIIEVNVSELGLVTQSGKVVWGKYAQVTNNPENDGCINAVLLV